jgi:hypothetical protein
MRLYASIEQGADGSKHFEYYFCCIQRHCQGLRAYGVDCIINKYRVAKGVDGIGSSIILAFVWRNQGKKTKILINNTRSSGRDLKARFPEYEASVQPTRP